MDPLQATHTKCPGNLTFPSAPGWWWERNSIYTLIVCLVEQVSEGKMSSLPQTIPEHHQHWATSQSTKRASWKAQEVVTSHTHYMIAEYSQPFSPRPRRYPHCCGCLRPCIPCTDCGQGNCGTWPAPLFPSPVSGNHPHYCWLPYSWAPFTVADKVNGGYVQVGVWSIEGMVNLPWIPRQIQSKFDSIKT